MERHRGKSRQAGGESGARPVFFLQLWSFVFLANIFLCRDRWQKEEINFLRMFGDGFLVDFCWLGFESKPVENRIIVRSNSREFNRKALHLTQLLRRLFNFLCFSDRFSDRSCSTGQCAKQLSPTDFSNGTAS